MTKEAKWFVWIGMWLSKAMFKLDFSRMRVEMTSSSTEASFTIVTKSLPQKLQFWTCEKKHERYFTRIIKIYDNS